MSAPARAVDAPAHRGARRIALATCCAIHVVQDGLIATLYVLFPLLAQALGLSYAQVGVIRALHTVAMSGLEIPSGILAERAGERSLLALGLFCAGLGYLCLSLSSGMSAVAASLFVAGIGAAFQHALCSSVISRAFAATAPRGALGTYNSAGDAGKLVFTSVFSMAVGYGLAWQQVVGGFGVIALAGAVAAYGLLARAGIGRRRASRASGQRRVPGWGIRDRRGFGALMLIVFLDIGVQSSFLVFLAFLMLEKQVPASLASLAVVLTLAGGVLGKFTCGFLADRMGIRRSLMIIQAACAAAIVSVAFAPTLVAYCLLPLLGVVLQGSSSITYGTVSELVDRERHARAFGIVYTVSGLASIVPPVVFGSLGDRFGLTPVMALMACVVLLTIPLSGLLRGAPVAAHGR